MPNFKQLKMMKAAVYLGPYQIRVQEVPIPTLRTTQVLLKIHAASICGTDFRIYRGETDLHPGRILGHDFSGTIVSVGSKVRGVHVGDNVAVSPVGHCGRCRYCLSGIDTLCVNGAWHGFERDGGFAQFVAVDAKNIVKLSKGVNLDQSAMLEPFVVALRCFDRVHVNRGNWICVFGQGAIGLAITYLARLMGLQIITVDPNRKRCLLSEKFGAKRCFSKLSSSVVNKVMKLTRGEGVDIAIDASGSQIAVNWTREVVKTNGVILFTGSGTYLRGPLINCGGKELSYIEVELGPMRLYRQIVQMIATGRINPLVFKPTCIGLEQLPDILSLQAEPKITAVKILVYPNKFFPSR